MIIVRPFAPLTVCALAALFLSSGVHAQNPGNVLVLYNQDSADGLQIANYYASVHPGVQLLPLSGVSQSEQITANQYLTTVRPQVLSYLNSPAGAQITTLVTTKGLPLRIYNSEPNPGTYPGWRGQSFGAPILNDWWKPYSSLESELTRIDRISTTAQMGDQAYFMGTTFGFPTPHQAANPYYGATTSFNRTSFDGMRLTARLDGYTASDVIGAINRAATPTPAPSGAPNRVVIDNDPTAPAASTNRMPALKTALIARQAAYAYDNTGAAITSSMGPVAGYVSHGVNNGSGALEPGYIAEQLQFSLANGAVFDTWESYNAYSFTAGGGRNGQGLIADWLAIGGTAGVGNVEEPRASAATVINEDILFSRLLSGMTFAEAAWAATPQLSFVNTIVGDPLMRWSQYMLAPTGDANGDGMVTDSDYTIWSNNYGSSAANWHNADWNGDGFVTDADYTIWSDNYGYGVTTGVPVPEPATLALLVAGGIALIRRRH